MANNNNRTPHDPSKPLGHANPPIETQFKDGNPGGPGRPKGVSSAEAVLKKLFRDRIELNVRNKKITKSMGEVMIKRGQKMIIEGSDSSFFRMLELYEKYGPAEEPPKEVRPGNLKVLGLEFLSVFHCILTRAEVYIDKEIGDDVPPMDPRILSEAIGKYEFYAASDGHIALRRLEDENVVDDPYLIE
jgi:hypothetical protein